MLVPDGNKIQTIRHSLRWTQEQLAEASGLSDRTIRNAEKSKGVSEETLMSIAAAMDIPHYNELLVEDPTHYNCGSHGNGKNQNVSIKQSERIKAALCFQRWSQFGHSRFSTIYLLFVAAVIFMGFVMYFESDGPLFGTIAYGVGLSLLLGYILGCLFLKLKHYLLYREFTDEDKLYVANTLMSAMHIKGFNADEHAETISAIRSQALAVLSNRDKKASQRAMLIALGLNEDHQEKWKSLSQWESCFDNAVKNDLDKYTNEAKLTHLLKGSFHNV